MSLQPNAGSQGEYAGLLAIRRYHDARGDSHRDICLIPSSAHGTNPASAHMAGMEVVVVSCDANGNIDLDDLKAKATAHAANLAALMITYPSTHGVFEEEIIDICDTVHEHGGQVYLDGANLNALVGTGPARRHRRRRLPHEPAQDLLHSRMAAAGRASARSASTPHLVPFLPGHVTEGSGHAVAAAPFGSASILPITWMYIRMMGAHGAEAGDRDGDPQRQLHRRRSWSRIFRCSTRAATAASHTSAFSTRACVKESAGVSVEDIAKRLIDYGFHAPTMSLAGRRNADGRADRVGAQGGDRPFLRGDDLDRASEIARVEKGEWPQGRQSAEPTHRIPPMRCWPPSGRMPGRASLPPIRQARDLQRNTGRRSRRIDNVAGDRNLVCACPPVSEYAKAG